MPRSTNSTLNALLPACATESTVDIALRDGNDKYFCTGEEVNLGGNDYLSFLLRVGELKETLGQSTNRVQVAVSNVDQQFGLNVASGSRKTELADVVIRRFYRDLSDPNVYEWRHFFTGKAVNAEVTEKAVTFDVIPDTTAAGTCIATETLSPLNGWVFPEIPDQSPPGSGGNPGDGVGTGVCFIGTTNFIFCDKSSLSFEKLYENRELYIGRKAALSFDENNQPVRGLIKAVFRHSVNEYLEVTFKNGTVLGVTDQHPFFTENFEYISIGQLKKGDRVLSDEGKPIEICSIEMIEVPEGVWVFNAEIEEFENYSANGLHVHNRSDDPNL